MKLIINQTPALLGRKAAELTAEYLNGVIAEKGSARIVVSTGASQFDTFEALIASGIDWSKVEMFHLDEYVDLPESHPASFRKYLKERFVSKVELKAAHFVEGTEENLPQISAKLLEAPIDLGLIGIGENSHIAFNDPPADFETTKAYIVVELDEACRRQQVGEGWFATLGDVPRRAVTMSVHRIMQCEKIISCVPYAVKAQAVADSLYSDVSPMVPASILKTHKDWTLLLDKESAALVDSD
ncbi:MAG: glucosamine-6-phosphate deaminase [Clostridiales bacterium]|nr:glucosamine-6-phosphate deaminase [Clostridiales bacterium]